MKDIMKLYPRYKYELFEDAKYLTQEELIEEIDYRIFLDCRYGTISQYDANTLLVITAGIKLKKKLTQLDFKKEIIGDEELIYHIDKQHFKKVCKILKPLLNKENAEKIRNRLHK